MPSHTAALMVCCVASAVALAGCSSSTTNGDASTVRGSDQDGLSIAAAFYPVEFVAQRVGGDHVNITTLTAQGVEPHDLELSPAVARELQNSDAVLFLSGFQAAVDDAITATGAHGIDAQAVIDSATPPANDGGDDDHDHDHDHDHDEHDGHSHHHDGDPHFWLDPVLLAAYGHQVAAEFAQLDPVNAAAFEANAQALDAELTQLDNSFSAGLATCARHDLYVSHEAFGYLANRFGLSQHGLSGLDPEAEPSPARVREVRAAIAATSATTVYSESAVDAAAIEALARDAGVDTAVLDPVEGVSGDDDYIDVMTRNLEALRAGLDCA